MRVKIARRGAASEPRISRFDFRASAAQKGCQTKPGVLHRNPMKTITRRAKRVSTFRDGLASSTPAWCNADARQHHKPSCATPGRISTRQCCRIEIAATHSKHKIAPLSTRQFFGGPQTQFSRRQSKASAADCEIHNPRLASLAPLAFARGKQDDDSDRIVRSGKAWGSGGW